MKNRDYLFKRNLIDAAFEASNDTEYKFGSGGWFREFSDFLNLLWAMENYD